MSKQKYKTIEYHLYNFKKVNMKIKDMKEELNNFSYNHSYNKFIKYKCSNVEREVFRRIDLENKISKEEEWLKLIKCILKKYRNEDKMKYDFIILKYIKKLNKKIIERKLGLNSIAQKDMNAKILHHIFLIAKEKNILKKEVD